MLKLLLEECCKRRHLSSPAGFQDRPQQLWINFPSVSLPQALHICAMNPKTYRFHKDFNIHAVDETKLT